MSYTPSPRAVRLALVLLTLAAFAPACGNGFVYYDDKSYVTENPHVLGGLTLANVRWAFTTRYAANWHPLTWLSLQLDATLFGKEPFGFHLTNVLLHTASVTLLFAALHRLSGDLWPSAAAAALFGLHPLRVESVAWIAERKDVLSTFFWMLTLLAYADTVAHPRWWRWLGVHAAFALGLLAKPMLVTLPCVLLLLDCWPLRRFTFGRVVEKTGLFALSAVSCAATVWAQKTGGAVANLEVLPLPLRLGNAVVAYVTYLWQTVWPVGLAAFYPHAREGLAGWQITAAALILAGVTALCLGQVRRRPYLAVGWCWYLGTLVPVIGLVQVGEQAHADRYTYIPHVGLFLMAAWGAADLAAAWRVPRKTLAAGTAGLFAALVVLTGMQVRRWRDPFTLWEHALAVTQDNYVAHHNLGERYLQRQRWPLAEQHFAAVVRIHPQDVFARHRLGVALVEQGKLAEAEHEFAALLVVDERLAEGHIGLGRVAERHGRLDVAVAHYEAAAALEPDNVELRRYLENLLAMRKKRKDAMP